jgi:hypothetical protein
MWMADPHVISALREKRAELSGELIAAEKRILQLRTDIDSLDGAIRVFDPTSEPHKIRPILRRKKSAFIPRGQCSRAILDMLRRADSPMTAREISCPACSALPAGRQQRGCDERVVAKVRNTHRPALRSRALSVARGLPDCLREPLAVAQTI